MEERVRSSRQRHRLIFLLPIPNMFKHQNLAFINIFTIIKQSRQQVNIYSKLLIKVKKFSVFEGIMRGRVIFQIRPKYPNLTLLFHLSKYIMHMKFVFGGSSFHIFKPNNAAFTSF